jgi:hypothetical protein
MRRVVNMLQSLSLMDAQAAITSEKVYDFTGNPSPKLLNVILNRLFTKNFD